MQNHPPIFCLMGPTASGKTKLAIELVQKFPFEIISVDSGMVYKGMDIGTAKPTETESAIAPHRLIDLNDPSEPYSAGQFCIDATKAIQEIYAATKIPLLVGGTMLYFKALQQGLANLPQANPRLREDINKRAELIGWPALHHYLSQFDPSAAAKIAINDTQRIQRAIEIYELTGKPLSLCIIESKQNVSPYKFNNIILAPDNREVLHDLIVKRADTMLNNGLIKEVEQLFKRGDLHPNLPSIRAVGYRQTWQYLDGAIDYPTMREQIIIATRQLAKHQLTWLRSWEAAEWFTRAEDITKSIKPS